MKRMEPPSQLPSHLQEFIRRWNDEANQCQLGDQNLAPYFDCFFRRFVVYNALYNHIGNRVGREKDRATKGVIRFLGADVLANALNTQRREVLRLLKSGRFYIICQTCDREELINPMEYGDDTEKAKALLLGLYKLRCNMFHGEKQFIPAQKDILKPFIEILEIVNSKLELKLNGTQAQ